MSETQLESLPEELYNYEWKPGMLYGRKVARWLNENYSEVYVEELDDLPDEEGYAVKYREGRLGPSEELESFEDEDAALEFVENALEPAS